MNVSVNLPNMNNLFPSQEINQRLCGSVTVAKMGCSKGEMPKSATCKSVLFTFIEEI